MWVTRRDDSRRRASVRARAHMSIPRTPRACSSRMYAPIEKFAGRPSAGPCLARKIAFERTSQHPFAAPYSGAPTLSCVTLSPKSAGRSSPCRTVSAHFDAIDVIVGLSPKPPGGGSSDAFIAAPSTAKCAHTSADSNCSDSSYSYCSAALVATPRERIMSARLACIP